MSLNLKTTTDIQNHFEQCNHIDAIHTEYGMARIIWCPSCGALMSPHESLIKAIAARRKPVFMVVASMTRLEPGGNAHTERVYAVVPTYSPHILIQSGKPTIIKG